MTPAGQTESARPPRRATEVEVVARERLSRDLVRLHLSGEGLRALAQPLATDSYVKLLFPPEGADYAWPFDPEEIRASRPREEWPVTRTYTIHSVQPDAARLAIDFVVHGDTGLAGPWAVAAQPGDRIGFLGPGGGWSPDPDARHHLYVGDEAAYPAIAAALERMAPDAAGTVFLEVADAEVHLPLAERANVEVVWVHRDETRSYGGGLVEAVQTHDIPGLVEGASPEGLRAFVHGNAEMIKELRRYLFVEKRMDRTHVSISGYWRPGQNEDAWQAGKREFVAQMEQEQDG